MKKIAFFLTLLFLVSCTSNTIYKKPDDLIPKDTMTALITDLIIASSAKYKKNLLLERKVNYIPLVYDKYKIDSVRFEKSNIYYTSKIDEYEVIFKEVKQNLSQLKDSLLKEQKVLDSINRKEQKKRTELSPKDKKIKQKLLKKIKKVSKK